MIFGGLFGGLGGIGRSLLGGSEKFTRVPTIGRVPLSTIGSIVGTLGKYRAQSRALSNSRILGNIREMYARSNMAEHAGDMMDGAVANYGKLLQSGAHIGGVMPNYYSGTLDRLSRGWRNYLADDHAMLYNASQRDYSYGASRLANAMQRNSALLSTAFDLYDRGRKYSMPGWRGYEYPSYQAYTVEEDLL